jgi:hypothetical protein
MGCPALRVSVAFLKLPALPGKAPKTKKNLKKSKSLIKIPNESNESKVGQNIYFLYCPAQGDIVGREYIHFVKKFCEPQRLMPF